MPIGVYNRKFDDITNKRFGHLVAIEPVKKGNRKQSYWLFKCDCGVSKVMDKTRIKKGEYKTCGCKKPYNQNHFYSNIHKWIGYHYGKASCCEYCGYKENPRFVQWALLHTKKLEKNRENFIELCVWCHGKYDNTHFKKGHKPWNKGKKLTN